MEKDLIFITISLIIILSYFFDTIVKWLKIPSVLLLLVTGIGFRYVSDIYGFEIPQTKRFLEILGQLGLILIVLEAALDLKISPSQKKILIKSLGAAFLILLSSCFLIAWLIQMWTEEEFLKCFVNAIPLAVISSAITIPSVANLKQDKKEFLIYESTFSDIIGIMLFNFAVQNETIKPISFVKLGGELIMVTIFSLLCCLILLFFIDRIRFHIKFFLILAIIVLVYSVGKLYHLSPLILILIFGLALNNTELYLKGKYSNIFKIEKLRVELKLIKQLTAEMAFLIRTFFFVLFGFSMNLVSLQNMQVLMIGGIVVAALLLVRLIYLKFAAKVSLMPELFIAPRGLITILLFYSIPSHMLIEEFSEGILFIVILLTSILMMFGLIISKSKDDVPPGMSEAVLQR